MPNKNAYKRESRAAMSVMTGMRRPSMPMSMMSGYPAVRKTVQAPFYGSRRSIADHVDPPRYLPDEFV